MLKPTSPVVSGLQSAAPESQSPPTFVINVGVINAPKPGMRVVETELACGAIKVGVEGDQKIPKTVQVDKIQKALVKNEKMPEVQKPIVKPQAKMQKAAPQKKRKQKNWYLQEVLREYARRERMRGPVQGIYRSTGEPIPEIKMLTPEEMHHKRSLLNEWQQKIKEIM